MPASRRVWRGISLVHLTLWACVMIVLGALCFLEFPGRFPTIRKDFFLYTGIILIAMGQFVAAVTADRLFPGVDPRVTGVVELVPWVVIIITLLRAFAGAWM